MCPQRAQRTLATHIIGDASVARALRYEGTPRLILGVGAWVAATLAASRAVASATAIMVKARTHPGAGDAVATAAWTAEEYMARRTQQLVSAVVDQVRSSCAAHAVRWRGRHGGGWCEALSFSDVTTTVHNYLSDSPRCHLVDQL